MCLLSFPVFTASCAQKAMGVASCHIYGVFQDFMWCWWFNCIVLLHNSLWNSVLLLFLQELCAYFTVSHLENVWSLRLLNQEMPWVLELMKSYFIWIRVLRLIDVDAKENENAVAVLLLNFVGVLCLVASLLYNKVWAYAVVFLPIRVLIQTWSSVWLLVHAMEVKEV